MDICTKNRDKLSFVGQFGLRNMHNLSCPIRPILGKLLCKCLDSAVFNIPMVGQLSDSVLSIQYLDSVVSNSPLVGLCCVHCPTACELSVQ